MGSGDDGEDGEGGPDGGQQVGLVSEMMAVMTDYRAVGLNQERMVEGKTVTMVTIAAILSAVPQGPSRCPTATQPADSLAWPFPPGRHRQLPGAGEDLAGPGDPGALLDGVLPGEHPCPFALGQLAP